MSARDFYRCRSIFTIHSSVFFRRLPELWSTSPNNYFVKGFLCAILNQQIATIMKTLLAIQIIHLVMKAAQHAESIIHSIGHLVK